MGKALFITGTGTNVGKTALSLAVLLWARRRGLKAAYLKPVQCGEFPFGEPALRGGDAEWIRALAGTEAPARAAYRFRLAASPHLAAEREGARILRSVIIAEAENLSAESDLLIVEGSGGAAVPLDREGATLSAWAAELGIPALIACAPGLGTLHHTLTTVAYLRGLNAPIAGFAFCHREADYSADAVNEFHEELADDNRATLRSLTGLAFFGSLPYSARTGRGIPMPPTEAEAWWEPLSGSLDAWWNSGRA